MDDPSALFDTLNRSAIAAARAGQVDMARRHVEEAESLAQASWPPRQHATGCFARGELLEAEDRLAEAHLAQEERIKLLMRAGEQSVQLHAHSQLVTLELALGNADAAIARGRRVMAELSPGMPLFRARTLMVSLAQALIAKGFTDEATNLLARAVPLMKGSTAQWMTLDVLAQMWARLGDAPRAARLLACADAMYRTHGAVRKPHAVRARNALFERLSEALPNDLLRETLAEGEDMSEEGAVALAMAFPEESN